MAGSSRLPCETARSLSVGGAKSRAKRKERRGCSGSVVRDNGRNNTCTRGSEIRRRPDSPGLVSQTGPGGRQDGRSQAWLLMAFHILTLATSRPPAQPAAITCVLGCGPIKALSQACLGARGLRGGPNVGNDAPQCLHFALPPATMKKLARVGQCLGPWGLGLSGSGNPFAGAWLGWIRSA
jgi:hypothetical protein